MNVNSKTLFSETPPVKLFFTAAVLMGCFMFLGFPSILSVTSAFVFPLVTIVILWPLGLDGFGLNSM